MPFGKPLFRSIYRLSAVRFLAFAGVAGLFVTQAQMTPQTPESPGQTLVSQRAVLSFPHLGIGGYGLKIHDLLSAGPDAATTQPVQMLVCPDCTDQTVEHPFTGVAYTSLAPVQGGVQAEAAYTSPNGSTFRIDDVYSVAPAAKSDGGSFVMKRTVTVLKASPADKGFNSQFLLGFDRPVDLERYHFFAPAIWYDHNESSAQVGAFGTNPLNSYFYWRETRSALPLMMAQDPRTGSTLTIAHINSTPEPGLINLNNAWQVDPTVQYGSIGVQKVPAVALGFIYPGSEGDGSYLSQKSYLANGPSTNWVRRSHPVTANFSHTYTLMLTLGRSIDDAGNADFKRAMASTWRLHYDVFNPAIASVPGETVYQNGINLVNGYVEDVNGATGLPFGRPVMKGVKPQVNPVYEMGYVGQDIPLGFQLYRYGVLHGDAASEAHGKAILDFWATKAGQPSGLPLAVYDATLQKFGTLGGTCPYPLFTRLVSDGMEGMALAAIFARQHNLPQTEWESFAQGYADWLSNNQNKDGSFYRAYGIDGAIYSQTCLDQDPYASSKANTADPIRFLVEMYFATGSRKYLRTAQQAGDYSLKHIYDPVQYVGGTIDNPNVIDKEGGVEALHGALALLDAALAEGDRDGATIWLAAAQHAAEYTRTWQYAWNFPITLPQGTASSGAYPAYQFAGNRAVGIIATGQSSADISLSYESYDFFRLYLFEQEAHRNTGRGGELELRTANQFWNNTKLTTQLSGVTDQQFNFVKDGQLGEGVDLSGMVYGGMSSGTWLPWLTNAEIDPIQRVQDTFRVGTLPQAEQQNLDMLEKENRNVYPAPGSIGWGH